MILTDREIKIAIHRGLIRIQPPPEEICFSSTAVDLTLDPTITIFNDHPPGVDTSIDPCQEGFNSEDAVASLSQTHTMKELGYLLRPNRLTLAWTREFIALRTETRLAARVEGKSSLARLGLAIHMTAPTIHSGFEGPIRLEIINYGIVPIRLRAGMRICQLILETTLGTPERGYSGQFYRQVPTRKRRRVS